MTSQDAGESAALATGITMAYLDLSPPAGAPPQRGTLLLLHGFRDRKESLRGIGADFAAQGFRVVVPDLRGHGGSTGSYLGFGPLDGRDLASLLDHLGIERDEPVGVIGLSYGGAAALHVAARDPRIAGVMTVSTFSSMESAVASHLRAHAPGLPLPRWAVRGLVGAAGRMAGYDAALADSTVAAAATDAHLLILHGSADVQVPVEQAHALARAAGADARLFVAEGAGHEGALGDGAGAVRDEVATWLNRWARATADR